MFETFEHTADVGLRVASPNLAELFTDAARGLMSLLVENPADVRPRQASRIEIPGAAIDFLLFDWLNELLFRFETQHTLFCEFVPVIADDGLTADVWGEPMDLSRHHMAHEVKAITYHQFEVKQSPDGWTAHMIFDI